MLPNSFYKASITLIPKPVKKSHISHTHTHTHTHGKSQVNILDEHRCKSPQANVSKTNLAIYEKDHTPRSHRIYPRDEWMAQQTNQSVYIH